MSNQRSMQSFFTAAAGRGAEVEVWIDHPAQDFCLQKGVCLEAGADYVIIGPKNQPGRIGLPYVGMRWFRALDEQ